MASTRLMQWLLLNYAVIVAATLYERNYPMALYWLSAFGITTAVLIMGPK